MIFKSDLIKKDGEVKIRPFILDRSVIEIQSYQDWWVCEKLIGRRRIVFRSIGNIEIGMGHIYRDLTLAHEITDHEIIFVCEEKDQQAFMHAALSDYMVHVAPAEQIEKDILDFKPHLVINDMLYSSAEYVNRLKAAGIRVVNFEDLGPGAAVADVTFNDIFDDPLIDGKNILWGPEYFFLREEFVDARPREFVESVGHLLITFGGTDQFNLTMKTLRAVLEICRNHQLYVHIVTGPGIHTRIN